MSEWLLKASTVCGVVGGSWSAPVTIQSCIRRPPPAHRARVYLLSWGHRLCVALGQTGFTLTASVPLRHAHTHTLAQDLTLFILVTGYGSEVILQQYSVTTTSHLPQFKLNSSSNSSHSGHKHQHLPF